MCLITKAIHLRSYLGKLLLFHGALRPESLVRLFLPKLQKDERNSVRKNSIQNSQIYIYPYVFASQGSGEAEGIAGDTFDNISEAERITRLEVLLVCQVAVLTVLSHAHIWDSLR
jgi:hypothetical protein